MFVGTSVLPGDGAWRSMEEHGAGRYSFDPWNKEKGRAKERTTETDSRRERGKTGWERDE